MEFYFSFFRFNGFTKNEKFQNEKIERREGIIKGRKNFFRLPCISMKKMVQ